MLKVLVVDDSLVMRRMVARSLDLSGLGAAKVYEAGSGEEALALVRETWIDLVLCDVHMPAMGGLELVRRMAADDVTKDVPVVMVSSDRNQERMGELSRLGVRGYVVKPFQPEALGRVVREALGLGGAS